MHKYSMNLTLPFNTADLIHGVIRDHARTEFGHFPYDIETFDRRIVDLFSDRGIQISHLEVFYTPPHRQLAIHIDGAVQTDVVKLNWVWGGEGSRMMWWKTKSDKDMMIGETPVKTKYLYADQKACTMIESAIIQRPTLINAGVLHSVLNSSVHGRWCLSIVLQKDGAHMKWEDAVDLLHDLKS
jgi:hypothetical protein